MVEKSQEGQNSVNRQVVDPEANGVDELAQYEEELKKLDQEIVEESKLTGSSHARIHLTASLTHVL
jgi:hypothetical protein